VKPCPLRHQRQALVTGQINCYLEQQKSNVHY
jgi:hypothetical protein